MPNKSDFQANFQKYDFPKLGWIQLPQFKLVDKEASKLGIAITSTSEEYLTALVQHKLQDKIQSGVIPQAKIKDYTHRVNFELKEIIRLLFTDYILLVYGIICFCKDNHILNGPARGSAGGSLLLFILDVVKIDAIKHNLLFERFISAARTEVKEIDGQKYISSGSLADVDIDCDRGLKHKVNEYIESQFPNKTAPICTFGTFQGKAIIKECLKVMEGISEDDAKHVSDMIESRFGKVEEIGDAVTDNQQFGLWAASHKAVVEVAQKLQGLIRNKSTHASGIILCNDDIRDVMPMELSPEKKPICGYNMDFAQMFGIKIDNLGLKSLGIIKDCLALLNLQMEDIDVNHPSIYTFINTYDEFYGVFQAEEGLGKNVLKKLDCHNIDDIMISIALGRPGCMRFVDDIVDAKRTGKVKTVDPRIDHILAPTYNQIIYQEQIMKLCSIMAKFTPLETNKIRKCMGKKLDEEIKLFKDKFVEQSISNKFDEKLVLETWKTFEASGNYIFNASHAAGYSYLTAITLYLKANHPKEFLVALLKNARHEQSPIEEIGTIAKEFPKFGLTLFPPNLIRSELDFTIEGEGIRFGLGAIKSISDKTLEKLMLFRKEYSTPFEIFESASQAKLSIGVLSALIQSGCLDGFTNLSRLRLVLDAQIWRLLTVKERCLILPMGKAMNFDLVAAIKKLNVTNDEKGKPYIKDSRYATIKKNSAPYTKIYNLNKGYKDLTNYIYERQLLGFAYSKRLCEIYGVACPDIIDIKEVLDTEQEEYCRVVAFVDYVTEGKSREKKNPYVRYDLSDETGKMSALLFGQKIGTHKAQDGLLKEGDIVYVEGRHKNNAIFADKITHQKHTVYKNLAQLKDVEAKEDKESVDKPK